MSSILIYHHLGLGDHIMCHGIVREYCKKYDSVGLFCHYHNYPSVSFMFSDIRNLIIIKGNDHFAREYIRKNAESTAPKFEHVKIIGYENLNRNSGQKLEEQFYSIAQMDLEKKWSSFFVPRDKNKEDQLYLQHAPTEEYVFLHEDTERGFAINKNRIDKRYKIFRPDPKFTNNIFDYRTIIERAKEVHVIDSSFMFMIDCLSSNDDNHKLFIHRYARNNLNWKLPILKKRWVIFNVEDYSPRSILKFLKWEAYKTMKKIG